MTPFIAELTGTAILLILGDGVVANVVLNKTKGNNGGLISITLGWAMAVFVSVYITSAASGAHLNPAVTLALAIAGKFSWSLVPAYCAAQLLGAMLGAAIVWITYRRHFDETTDPATQLAVFCTSPSIRAGSDNFFGRSRGNLRICYWRIIHYRCRTFAWFVKCSSCCIPGFGDRIKFRWTNRICHQPRPRFGTAHCSCTGSDEK